MRGVAVDCTNKPPSAIQIKRAGLDSIRIEMRDLPSFYEYTYKVDSLSHHQILQTWLIGPSTGPVESILDKLLSRSSSSVRPQMVIIGNEPDGSRSAGSGSWIMSPDEYVALWNHVAPLILAEWPDVELTMAGMYSKEYAFSVNKLLKPEPNFLNMHYPAGIDQFLEFSQEKPCIVGEWCWRTASRSEMHDWVKHFLDYYAWGWFWFCWADYMVPNMGLVTASSQYTKAYRYLKEALG